MAIWQCVYISKANQIILFHALHWLEKIYIKTILKLFLIQKKKWK